MKNSFYLLLALVVAVLIGCKPKNIDIDDALKQISEETFAKTPSRSCLEMVDNDLLVVEYTFDVASKTAVRKQVSMAQNAAYEGLLTENFTYSWGEFKNGMYGRLLYLKGDKGNRTLTYLNDQLNDGEIITSISEPRADIAANMIDGLTAGKWEAIDPTYVLQLHWVDTIVYEYHTKGKKIVCDTIHKYMPRPNYFDTIGIDSCFYYTYEFEKGAANKLASLNTDFQKNIVTADSTIQPQLQDPTKNDTIITYTVEQGERVFRSKVNYSYWAISNIKVEKEAQSMDVVLGQDQEETKLAITQYLYDGGKGSFVLDGKTYLFTPKN